MPNLIFPAWECYGHDITAWGDTAEEATENWIDAYQECYAFPFTGDVPVARPTERTEIAVAMKDLETRIQRAKTPEYAEPGRLMYIDEPIEPKTWYGILIAVLVGTVIGILLLAWSR